MNTEKDKLIILKLSLTQKRKKNLCFIMKLKQQVAEFFYIREKKRLLIVLKEKNCEYIYNLDPLYLSIKLHIS